MAQDLGIYFEWSTENATLPNVAKWQLMDLFSNLQIPHYAYALDLIFLTKSF